MNKSLLAFFFLLISLTSSATDFCVRSQQDLSSLLRNSDSRISFKNNGGLMNRGVCWWHSRLQRSSVYLVKFQPSKNPPTQPELMKIIHSLRVMDQVVLIPGYENFESFSRDYENELQAMLNGWQKSDGFLNFEWLRGISGRSSLEADEMHKRMEDVYRHYKTSPTPVWIMAQIKGITSHSYLILHMEQTASGYDLSVIDSNKSLDTLNIGYHKGDRFLKVTGGNNTFVPYVGFQKDFRKIASALKKECSFISKNLDLGMMMDGEIELKERLHN